LVCAHQASCLQHVLIEKVKFWAALSDGCFPIQQRQRETEQDSLIGCIGGDGTAVGHKDMRKSKYVRFSEIPDEDKVLS
jgi:hypothetical protein